MKRLSVTALAAAASLCLVAACGSSSSGSKSSSGTNNGGSSGGGGSTKKVQVVIGSVSGPDAPGFADGVRARIDAFNSSADAKGVTVKYVGNRNNNDDPNTDLTLIKQLVLNDHVDAELIYPTVTQPAAAQFLKQHNVSLFGPGYNPVFCGNDNTFSFYGCVVPGVGKQPPGTLPDDAYFLAGAPKLYKSIKGLRVAVIGQSVAGGKLYTDIWASTAKALGANVVYDQAPLPLSPTVDYQPFVSAVHATNPDLVAIITGEPSAIAFKAKWNQNGYKGVVLDNTYSPALLNDSTTAAALEGTYSTAQTVTTLDSGTFAKQMNANFAAAGIKESSVAVGTLMGYNSADLFVAMLQKAGGNVKDLPATINKGFSYTPDGGIPTTWPQDHTGFTKECVAILKAVKGKYELTVPFTCYH